MEIQIYDRVRNPDLDLEWDEKWFKISVHHIRGCIWNYIFKPIFNIISVYRFKIWDEYNVGSYILNHIEGQVMNHINNFYQEFVLSDEIRE